MVSSLEIQRAAKVIKNGGLVAFPTETVYGLGADAFNKEAVANIFKVKERPSFDPLIVHIAELNQLDELCDKVYDTVYLLAEKFWPGPLTIVLPKSERVPDIVTSGLPTVAVRMPSHSVALELIKKSGTPIAAPSANKFGMLSPTTAAHVKKQLPNVDYILDGGQTSVGIESTVISVDDDGIKILRPGVITLQEFKSENLKVEYINLIQTLQSPGLLKSHYSPSKPLFVVGSCKKKMSDKKVGFLAFGKPKNGNEFAKVEVLSENEDLTEAALNFFGALHRLEESDVDVIFAEPVPETGIGIAIMDRLNKAAYKYKY